MSSRRAFSSAAQAFKLPASRLSALRSSRPLRLSPLNPIPGTVRHASTRGPFSARFRYYYQDARKNYPILFPVLVVAAFSSISVLGLLVYDEITRVAPKFAAFPEEVEKQLRQALHYTHVRPDPDQASGHFERAIEEGERLGMNPFGKEFMGIRLRYAEMLEKFGRVKPSVEMLNAILKDCEDKFAALPTTENQDLRKALFRTSIEIRAKLAELYNSEYIQDQKKAAAVLSDGLDMLASHTKGGGKEGFTEDNLAGLSYAEIGALLSQMGDLFLLAIGDHSNAFQTYNAAYGAIHAANAHKPSCKEAQVVYNMAVAMYAGKDAPREKLEPIAGMLNRALDSVAGTPQPERDSICFQTLWHAIILKTRLLERAGGQKEATHIYEQLGSKYDQVISQLRAWDDVQRELRNLEVKAAANQLQSIVNLPATKQAGWMKGLSDDELDALGSSVSMLSNTEP